MTEKVEQALTWLKQILDSEKVDYQIVGGLAANIHGGRRAVADIDLYIRNEDIHRISPHIDMYTSKPLTMIAEHGWEVKYVQLIYLGQKVEIGLSDHTKIQSHQDGSWHNLDIDFSQSEIKAYHGIEVPVMPVHRLIEYKRLLAREVDLLDIQELTKS